MARRFLDMEFGVQPRMQFLFSIVIFATDSGFRHLAQSRHSRVLPKHEYSNSLCPAEYILQRGVKMLQDSRVQLQCRGDNDQRRQHLCQEALDGHREFCHLLLHRTHRPDMWNGATPPSEWTAPRTRQSPDIPLGACSGFKEKSPGYCRRPLSPAKIFKCSSLGYPGTIKAKLLSRKHPLHDAMKKLQRPQCLSFGSQAVFLSVVAKSGQELLDFSNCTVAQAANAQ